MDSTGSIIKTIVSLVRQTLDETSTNAKFIDALIVEKYLPMAVQVVRGRLSMDLDNPVFAAFPITVVPGTLRYMLPPNIREIHGLVQKDSSEIIQAEVTPNSFNHHDNRSRTWSLEGNEIRIEPYTVPAGTWYVLYIPNAELGPHYSTAGTLVDASTLTLANSPTLGLLDRRLGAYVGATVRVIPASGPIEERIVETHTHNGSVWQVTFRKPLTVNTTPGTVTYEVVPNFDVALIWALVYQICMAVGTARRINSGDMAQISRQYMEALKTVGDQLSNYQARTGKSFYVFDWAASPWG